MRYQYKREPLTPDEANRLANACQTHEEKLIIWTLLDTGLRVSELANLTKDNLDWQNHRLMIYGKGGILRWSPNFGQIAKIGSCS
jgi:integrase/recombinase XerD